MISIFLLVGCSSKKIPTVSSITVGEKQFIEQLVPVKIAGTNDTLTITSEVKWEVPKHSSDETISFAIAIPYTLTVDGVDYDGIYELGDNASSIVDSNYKYYFEVTDLTANGDIEILITEK